jgi:hypothetical protein
VNRGDDSVAKRRQDHRAEASAPYKTKKEERFPAPLFKRFGELLSQSA